MDQSINNNNDINNNLNAVSEIEQARLAESKPIGGIIHNTPAALQADAHSASGGLTTTYPILSNPTMQSMPNHLVSHNYPVIPSTVIPSIAPPTAAAPVSLSVPVPVPASVPASSGVTSGQNQPHHPVAEFLYQLTKMLTDDNNEIIEWIEGRIKVHFPERLESEVLHKYFRHSKFASFQRQLNYFGFRKIAGKGKMSPCSYVNESATSDIRSLLLIKRKTNGSAARKAMAQRALNLGNSLNPGLGIGALQVPTLAGAAQGFGTLQVGGPIGLSTVGQQLQLQKQFGIGLIENNTNNNVLSQLLIQNQQRQSLEDLHQLGGFKTTVPSIEQLQAQIATLTKQQNQSGMNGAFNAAALNFASTAGSATATMGFPQVQLQQQSTYNPATAALNATNNAVVTSHSSAMPATAAIDSSASAGQTNNLFESATNLKALIGNDLAGNNDSQKTLGTASALNNLIPNGASMGNLLASSNRLSSLLSLNSFLSREPSLADLAMIPNGAAQFAAYHQHQATAATKPATMSNDNNQSSNTNHP